MTYSLRVHSAADAEYAEILAWVVEHISRDYAIRLGTAIDHALDEILAFPLAWSQWPARTDVRVRHVREISYSVIYQVSDLVVTIVAFSHMHREPGYWLHRLT